MRGKEPNAATPFLQPPCLVESNNVHMYTQRSGVLVSRWVLSVLYPSQPVVTVANGYIDLISIVE